MVATEFDIIKRYFWTEPAADTTLLGVGDDAAILAVPEDQVLVTSIDTLNEGVHFGLTTEPEAIGHKSLAVSLSDMAAMGAKPIAAQLALSLPYIDERWLREFSKGFLALAKKYQVDLVGGDTTRGPLAINTVLYGLTPKGKAVKRRGAKVGDDIYVSGALGAPGFALAELARTEHLIDSDLQNTLDRPEPRVALGMALQNIATSMIDVSDGLHADLGHVLSLSHVAAEIDLSALPLSPFLPEQLDLEKRHHLALFAGDEYELCFSANLSSRSQIEALSQKLGIAITCIGRIIDGQGLTYRDDKNHIVTIQGSCYEHFCQP